MQRLAIIITLLACTLVQLPGQDIVAESNPEQEFARMRELATEGDYNAAKNKGKKKQDDKAGNLQ